MTIEDKAMKAELAGLVRAKYEHMIENHTRMAMQPVSIEVALDITRIDVQAFAVKHNFQRFVFYCECKYGRLPCVALYSGLRTSPMMIFEFEGIEPLSVFQEKQYIGGFPVCESEFERWDSVE